MRCNNLNSSNLLNSINFDLKLNTFISSTTFLEYQLYESVKNGFLTLETKTFHLNHYQQI